MPGPERFFVVPDNSASDRAWETWDMNKDRIAGAAKQATGAIKETAGKILGDAKLTADGQVEKAEGKIQNAIGGLKDTLKK